MFTIFKKENLIKVFIDIPVGFIIGVSGAIAMVGVGAVLLVMTGIMFAVDCMIKLFVATMKVCYKK